MKKVLLIIVLLFIFGYILYTLYGRKFRKILGDPDGLPDIIKDPCVFLENDIITDSNIGVDKELTIGSN